MKCHNCERPAMFGVGPEGKIPVCLDCYVKFSQVMDRQTEELERELNYIADEIEMTAGMPGLAPRFPPRPPRTVLAGPTTLNHMHISNSNIGVLSTGTIGTIDGAVGIMLSGGEHKAAQAFKTMTEAVANASDLAPPDKSKALEILSVVATEGAAPKERRRSEAMRTLLRDVSSALSGSAALVRLWEAAKPVIEALF